MTDKKYLRNEKEFLACHFKNYSMNISQNLSQPLNTDLKRGIFCDLNLLKIYPSRTLKSRNDNFLKGVSANNNSDQNSKYARKCDLYNADGLMNNEGDDALNSEEMFGGSFVPYIEGGLHNTEVNNTSNNMATLLAGLPQMAILNGHGQAGNIHMFCPENESCFLKPSDILSMPSKMVTDGTLKFLPLNFPFMDCQFNPSPMLPHFPVEMLHSSQMSPEIKKEQQMHFDPMSTWLPDGKVFFKSEFSKKFDQELTNSNLNIRDPIEHIVDCWSDDRINAKKYAKCSSGKKASKEKYRNRKPSPWKLFNKSKSKVKIIDHKYSKKDVAPRRTLSCTIEDGNISKTEEEYFPIPVKFAKYFRSLPSCGSREVRFGNSGKADDSTSWESHQNPSKFDHMRNNSKRMDRKRTNLKFPVTNISQMKYNLPHFYDMTSNSEMSSVSQSDFSQKLNAKYYKRGLSCHHKENNIFDHHRHCSPNHHKLKKSCHKKKQNILKNCFRLKVQGSRAFLEPLQKASRNDVDCKKIVQMLSSPDDFIESFFGVESSPFPSSHKPSMDEHLYKELVKIPDEFLKKSDNLSKQINIVDNHVQHLEKLFKSRYSSEHEGRLSLSKLDINCSSSDNKASKTLDLSSNIIPTMPQVKIEPSDIPSDSKKSNESGSTYPDKNVSFQEFQSLFDKYFDKLQKICKTTEHTKEICTLILDTVCRVRRTKMSSFDEESLKNELMGFDSEMISHPKNMQLNNHSITNLKSDLNFDIFPEGLVIGNEFKSSTISGSRPVMSKDSNFVKLSHNNNAPLQILKHKDSGMQRSSMLSNKKADKWIYVPDFGKCHGSLGNDKHSHRCAKDNQNYDFTHLSQSFPLFTTLKSENESGNSRRRSGLPLNSNNKFKNLINFHLENDQHSYDKLIHNDSVDSDDSEINGTHFDPRNNDIFEISMNNHNKKNKVAKKLRMLFNQNSNKDHKSKDKNMKKLNKYMISEMATIDTKSSDMISRWNINDSLDINWKLCLPNMKFIDEKKEEIYNHHEDDDSILQHSNEMPGSYSNNLRESLHSFPSNKYSSSASSFADSTRSSLYNCETLAFYSKLFTTTPHSKQTSSKKQNYSNETTTMFGNHCFSHENISMNLDSNDKLIQPIDELDASILEITEKFANAFRDKDDYLDLKSENLSASNDQSSMHIDSKKKQNYFSINFHSFETINDCIACNSRTNAIPENEKMKSTDPNNDDDDDECTSYVFKSDVNIPQLNLEIVDNLENELHDTMVTNDEFAQNLQFNESGNDDDLSKINGEHLFKVKFPYKDDEEMMFNNTEEMADDLNLPSREVDIYDIVIKSKMSTQEINNKDTCIRDVIDYIIDNVLPLECKISCHGKDENILPSLVDASNSYSEALENKMFVNDGDSIESFKDCSNDSITCGDFFNELACVCDKEEINLSKVGINEEACEEYLQRDYTKVVKEDIYKPTKNSVSDQHFDNFRACHSKFHKTESAPISFGNKKKDREDCSEVDEDHKIFCDEIFSTPALEEVNWKSSFNKFLNPELSDIKFGPTVSFTSQDFDQKEVVDVLSHNKSFYSVSTGNSSNKEYGEDSCYNLNGEEFVKDKPNVETIYTWKSLYDAKRDDEVIGFEDSRKVEDATMKRIIWDRTLTKQKLKNKSVSDLHDSKINLIRKIPRFDEHSKMKSVINDFDGSNKKEKNSDDSCPSSFQIQSNHCDTGPIFNSKVYQFDESLNKQIKESEVEVMIHDRIECFDLSKLNLLAQKFRARKFQDIYPNKKKMGPKNVSFANVTCDKASPIRKKSISKINDWKLNLKSDKLLASNFIKFQDYPDVSKEHQMKKDAVAEDLKCCSSQCLPSNNYLKKCVNFTMHGDKVDPDVDRFDMHPTSNVDNDFHFIKSTSNIINDIGIVSKNKFSTKTDFDPNSQKSPKRHLKVIEKDLPMKDTCAELHEKISDLQKKITLYKSRICEMKRHIKTKTQTMIDVPVEFYEHNKIHRHYANLLKIFKRKEYATKIRCSILKHKSARNSKTHDKNKQENIGDDDDDDDNDDDDYDSKPKAELCRLNSTKDKTYRSSNKKDAKFMLDYLNPFTKESIELLNSVFNEIGKNNSDANYLSEQVSRKMANGKSNHKSFHASALEREYGEVHHQKTKKFVVKLPSRKVERDVPPKTRTPCRKLNVVFTKKRVPVFGRNLKSPNSDTSSYKVVHKTKKSKYKWSGAAQRSRSVWARTEFPFKSLARVRK